MLAFCIAALAASCGNPLPDDAVLQSYDWSVNLESLSNPDRQLNLKREDFQCETVGRGEFKYVARDAEVVLKWNASKDVIEVTPTVTNKKDGWCLKSVIGPFIPVEKKIEEYNILMPVGYGEIFTKTPEDTPEFTKTKVGKEKFWKYHKGGKYFEISDGAAVPSTPCRNMTMQWLAFAGAADGVYIVSEDKDFTYKEYHVRYYPEEGICRFGLRGHHVLFNGVSWTYPTTKVQNYKGDWHAAADMYRQWNESVKETVPRPEWLKKSTGWLLCILKQQNDEIIWPYGDLPTKLADAAEARGLDIVGLFGWTMGGHDRWYPEYNVCPKMGGEETLRASLKEIRNRGMHSIIYVNGQLIDQNGTEFWPETGRHITVVKKDSSFAFETWHKYSDAPARTHGLACHSTSTWRDIMLNLAKKANDLGADGIIYDQLGNRTPMYCYSDEHGHPVPAIVFEQDRQANLDYVRSEMAKINPEFIVITEGTNSAELSAIDLFHGCTYGVYNPSEIQMASFLDKDASAFHTFPEMLKYTVPAIECTVRHPCPVATRPLLNYGVVYGFKHEIETRYAADRMYLLENHIPVPEDYGNVISKPNLKLVTTLDPDAMRDYSKQVLDLRRKYADALMYGTFRDNLGLSLKTDGKVIAKVFEAADKSYSAAVVWNMSDTDEASCELTFKGKKASSFDSPEGGCEGGKLAAQSIQVVIFK